MLHVLLYSYPMRRLCRDSTMVVWFFFCHLTNRFVGRGGEWLEETTNTFGGFQTPFTISIKDFCGVSVQDSSQVCTFYPIVFLSFPWIVWKFSCIFSCIFLWLFLCIFLCYFFSILPLISMPKNMKNSHNVKGGFKKLEWKIASLFF